MGSQVAMNTCTDANTHAKEGVKLEVGWMEQTHSATHFCMLLCKRGRADMGGQVDMYTCTDACAYSKQGMGPKAGWLAM